MIEQPGEFPKNSQQNINQSETIGEESKTEYLRGEQVAEIVKNIYETLGPELGCRFVEANAVLAIAGLKGVADIHWVILDESDLEKIDKLNQILEDIKIRLRYPKQVNDYSIPMQLSLYNLRIKEKAQILDSDSNIIYEGKLLGYPKQAILDFEDYYNKKRKVNINS